MQNGENGGLLLALRIMRDVFACGGIKFRRGFKGRVELFAGAGMMGDERVNGVFSVIGQGDGNMC